METLLVSTEFQKKNGNVLVHINLHLNNVLINKVYYEFYGDVLPNKTKTDDFALIAIMPYAMQHGYNLHINGIVHSDILRNMEESQDAWLRWHPDLFSRVSMSADLEVSSVSNNGRNAVMAFSGGLDATYALHAHANKLLGRRSCNIVTGVVIHGFDVDLTSVDIFDDALLKNKKILHSYGAAQTVVKTNWRELNTYWEQTHMFGIASVIAQFSEILDCGVIASDVAYNEEDLGWGSNAVTNPFFSIPSFPLCFTGGSHSRTQKASVVSTNPVVLENLRVCYQNKMGNCGKCEKCVRTSLNFLSVGVSKVDALGNIDHLKQINKLQLKTDKEVDRYRRILKEGYWEGASKERYALLNLVNSGPKQYLLSTFLKKTARSIRKRIPFRKLN